MLTTKEINFYASYMKYKHEKNRVHFTDVLQLQNSGTRQDEEVQCK